MFCVNFEVRSVNVKLQTLLQSLDRHEFIAQTVGRSGLGFRVVMMVAAVVVVVVVVVTGSSGLRSSSSICNSRANVGFGSPSFVVLKITIVVGACRIRCVHSLCYAFCMIICSSCNRLTGHQQRRQDFPGSESDM